MTTKIRQQMLDRLQVPDLSALEVEAALNVLLLLQSHPTLLGGESEAPFAPIPEPAKPAEPEAPKEKKITLAILRGKIVDARENKGITPADFLGKHGYAKLSDVPETAYADLYTELEAM